MWIQGEVNSQSKNMGNTSWNQNGAQYAMGNKHSQDLSPLGFGRIHYFPPYSIFCDWQWGLHWSDNNSQDSKMEV